MPLLTADVYDRLAADMVSAFNAADDAALGRLNAHYGRSFTFDDLRAEIWRRVYACRQREFGTGERTIRLDEAKTVIAQDAGFGNWATLISAAETPPGPAFAIDGPERRLAPRRYLTDREWNQIVAVMRERGLTGLGRLAILAGLLLVAPLAGQVPLRTPFGPLDADVRAGAFGHVDRIYVVRGGTPAVDLRYDRDYREISRGRVSPIGCGEGCADPARMHQYNYFHPDWHPFHQGRPVHTLQSVTKSIAATVVGVALQRGDLAPDALSRPFLEFFEDYDLTRIDPRLRRATLEDILTMRTGIEWHEGDRPLDATNTTVQLEWSRDWIQFTLDQPMNADPGTTWVYNSGGSALIAHVIREATGRHIDDYAREYLFGPLGITDVHWKRTPTGHPDTEGGLYLTAEDLAKIGLLYLRRGAWNGRRVLSDAFVTAATTRHVTGAGPGGTWDYGYQWWLTQRGSTDIWAGRGFGGQFLIVIPERDTVAVVLAWNVFGERTRNLFPALMDLLTAR